MSDFTDSDNNNKEIEILMSKKEELTNLLGSSKSNILSQALNQELKHIQGKLNVLKKQNNNSSNKFIDVYDNLDNKGNNYLSKITDYDLSKVTSFESNKFKKIEKEIKPIYLKDNTYSPDETNNLTKIYNKYVKNKKDSSSEYKPKKESSSEYKSKDFKTQSLLNCKEIIGIVKLLEKKDKNNKLVLKLKNSTRKLAESIDKQFK
jgi:hypothetical protein